MSAAFRTIKIRSTDYDQLQALLRLIAQSGWTAVSVDSREEPSLAAIASEAFKLLWSRRL